MSVSTPVASTAEAKPQTLRAAAPALIGLCLTMLVEMVDNSILNVALPTIGRDLNASPTDLQWIVGAYSLTFGGLLLVGGTLGDMIGRRRTLLWGLGLFGLAGLAVLLVTSPGALIVLRGVSGAFAALIAPLTMSLLFRLFDREDLRARAIGLVITTAMIGMAVGPTLAGLAVEHWPWQMLLVLNAPVAAIAWIGVRCGIAADSPQDRRRGSADVPGALLSITALAGLLYTLTAGVQFGWTSPITLGALVLGVASAAGFVWRERTATSPMLDLRLLGIPTVRGSALIQTAAMLALVGVMFTSTQLFQFAWGWTPWQAGLANLPFVGGMLLAGPLVDRAVVRLGHRWTSSLGIVLILASLGTWILAMSSGYLWCAIGMLLGTAGMRAIMTTGAVALMGALPESHTSIGSAMNDTAQEVGNAVGVAVIGTITAAVLGPTLPQGAWDAVTVAGFVHAQQLAFTILAGIVVAVAAVALPSLTNSKATED